MRRLPDEMEIQIVALYESGLSSRATARAAGTTQRTVMRTLKRRNVPTRDQATAQSVVKDRSEVVALYEAGLSVQRVCKATGLTFGAVRTALIRSGVEMRRREDYSMERAGAWRGGRTISDQGYVLIYSPKHARATPNGYVKEHILVMEHALGGPIPEGMEVHHINHIKTDNRPENLQLLTKREHARLHQRLKAGVA